MPRTKRPVKKQEKPAEEEDASKKFHKLVRELKKKIDAHALMELRNLDLSFKVLLGSIDNEYLAKTVGQLKSELYIPEVNKNARTASHDDVRAASSQSGARVRRSRSAEASCGRARCPSGAAQRRRSRSVYRTPAYNKHAPLNYPLITPKVAPHTPLTIVRQPRQGEMVVSMSGSPVVVPTCYSLQPDEKANCNILLQDGTMLSLQPKHLRQSQAYIPFSLMDNDVLDQLKTLQDNLGKLVKLGEKAMK